MTKQEEFEQSIRYRNLENFRLLLNDKKVDPSYEESWSIRVASQYNRLEFVEILLKDSRVDPTESHNWAINIASGNRYNNIVEILWKDQRIKNTLKKDHPHLYQTLINKDKIKNNSKYF